MKLSSKTLLRLAAVGVVLPIAYSLIYHFLILQSGELFNMGYPLWLDVIDRSIGGIVLVSLSIATFVIYHQRNTMPTPDKRFRVITYITAGILLFVIILGIYSFPIIHGRWFCIYVPLWYRCIEVVAIVTWLWMLSNRQGEETLSKPVAVFALCGGILALMVIALMIIAGIYVLLNGHVYNGGIGTFAYYQWVKTFVPLVVIGSYAISIMRKK